jgi:vacuolar-type H+-ATPase subunit H
VLQDTIEAVKETERTAAQKAKEAANEGVALVERAKQEAQDLKTVKIREANEKAAREMETAKEQGEKVRAESLENAKNEVLALKNTAAGKEPEAVKKILSQLV